MSFSYDDAWKPHGASYKQLHVADKTDEKILDQLRMYTILDSSDRVQPQYRQYRRMLIREALKRRLIDKDPGSPP